MGITELHAARPMVVSLYMKDPLFVEMGKRGQKALKKKFGSKLKEHLKEIGEKGRQALRKKLLG